MCRSRTTACPVLNGNTGNRMMDRGGFNCWGNNQQSGKSNRVTTCCGVVTPRETEERRDVVHDKQLREMVRQKQNAEWNKNCN